MREEELVEVGVRAREAMGPGNGRLAVRHALALGEVVLDLVAGIATAHGEVRPVHGVAGLPGAAGVIRAAGKPPLQVDGKCGQVRRVVEVAGEVHPVLGAADNEVALDAEVERSVLAHGVAVVALTRGGAHEDALVGSAHLGVGLVPAAVARIRVVSAVGEPA